MNADAPDAPAPPAPRRGRGRPAEVDPEAVARKALALFVERGYDETSLDDVAAAAGVSRRTLLRIFSSKKDLVWGGATEAIDRVRTGLAAAPRGGDPIDAVRQVYVAALAFAPGQVSVTRSRLRLIASSPELQAWGTARNEGAQAMIAQFVADRTGQRADDLGPRIAAATMPAAANAALFWWAEGDGDDPSVAVDDALRRVQRGLSG